MQRWLLDDKQGNLRPVSEKVHRLFTSFRQDFIFIETEDIVPTQQEIDLYAMLGYTFTDQKELDFPVVYSDYENSYKQNWR